MWYFQSTVDDDRNFLILPGKEYVIGRRDCDIVIEDQSVSRKHAMLSVTHPEGNVAHVNKPATLVLKDVSKFGSSVNNHKMKGERALRDGDEVRFGTPKSIHRAVYEPFIVTTSCVDGAGKKDVRSLVCKLGGHVSSEWRKDCRFLIMKSVTVTIKVVCALVSQTPIVTVGYLRDLLKYYKGQTKEKPQAEKYLPPVTERLIEPGVSFLANVKRSSVFLGMSFYFLSEKQFQKMNMAVELGGGVPILCDNAKDADLEAFLEDKTVVMNPTAGELVSQEQRDWVEKVKVYLTKKGKFMVQDAEIGYAALYASTSDYCNPDKDVSHLLPGALPSQSLTQGGSLASQLVTAQSQPSQLKPSFKKPEAVTVTRGKDDLSTDRLDRGIAEDSKPNPNVFTVPESLTEDSVQIKRESCVNEKSRSVSETQPSHVDNSVSQRGKTKSVTVKDEFSVHCKLSSSVQGSEALFDTDVQSVPKVKEENTTKKEKKPICLLEDEEDDVVEIRKPPPSKNKRRLLDMSDDDDDNPFHIGRKRPRKAAVRESEGNSAATEPRHHETSESVQRTVPSKMEQDPNESDHVQDLDPFDFVRKTTSSSKPNKRSRNSRSPSPAPRTTRRSPSPKPKSVGSANREEYDEQSSPVMISESRSPSPESNTCITKPGSISRRKENKDSSKVPSGSRSPSPVSRKKKPASSNTTSRSRSPSPEAITTPGSVSRQKEATSSRRSSGSRSPSPKPSSRAGPSSRQTNDSDSSTKTNTLTSKPSTDPQLRLEPKSSTSGPVPRGFLTTRIPLEDQVAINPNFEKENIDESPIIVHFEELVVKQNRPRVVREDQSDVPDGMMRWRGQLVPNFKKFNKVKHAGAGRLPKIIGGRDLEAHCGSHSKQMEDWLRDLEAGESQEERRDREAQKLFDYHPPSKAKKARR